MRASILGTAALVVLSGFLLVSGCASADDILVNKEAGFLYGYANGPTEQAAVDAAFDDFIYAVLVDTGSIPKEPKARVAITAEMRAAFGLLNLKPFTVEKKSETRFTVVFRISEKDWTTAESKRLEGLATDLGGKFDKAQASSASLAAKVKEGAAILSAIRKNGVSLKLPRAAGATDLLKPAVEAWLKGLVQDIVWTLSPDTGLLSDGATISVKATGASGAVLAGLPVETAWATLEKTDTPAKAATDKSGTVVVGLSASPDFLNQKVTLKVRTGFQAYGEDVALLGDLDSSVAKEYAFRHSGSMGSAKNDDILVTGGTFTIGKRDHDTTFGVSAKEPVREVTVKSFRMDRNLVTNGEFKVFLEATGTPKEQWPDYLDNEDFNADAQPVIGVSIEQAKAYAAWISKLLGVAKRLPTEEEYEVAARAGSNVIYPWGDQKPSDGVRAAYAGNGRFTATAPVGSFPNGANALGIMDLSGNVWQWTSSLVDGKAVAKGGSYMEKAMELRISARRFEDPAVGFADIGFRLVREADNE